ncbi:MAG: hypothetical protein NTX50_20925 [Candidatus Sumerlaeota bacterium]|nr:hypothetical protein [Candidatus Sumerlaeota bacterium]
MPAREGRDQSLSPGSAGVLARKRKVTKPPAQTGTPELSDEAARTRGGGRGRPRSQAPPAFARAGGDARAPSETCNSTLDSGGKMAP